MERPADRFSGIDLRDIKVRKATSDADFETVAYLREAGFSRLLNNKGNKPNWVDENDRKPGMFSLIGYSVDSKPVVTMRVEDGRTVNLDIERFVNLDDFLQPEDRPLAQFSRLSVLKMDGSMTAVFGIFKAAWRWAFKERIRNIIISSPRWMRPTHKFMFFESVGPRGEFSHELAGGAKHLTMKLPVMEAEGIWRAGGSPLCQQFFDTDHPDLHFYK